MSEERRSPVEVREPELRQSTPRRIRIREKCRINRWAPIVAMLVLPGGAACVGLYYQTKWTKLKEHGVETIATLIEKQERATGKRKHPPRGYYSYTVKGVNHRLIENWDDAEYRNTPLGHQRPIVYQSDNPAYAAMRDDVAARSVAQEAVAVWIIGGTIGLLLLGNIIHGEWVRWGRVRLARYGTAVTATTLEVEPAAINSFNKRWKVAYTFAYDGATYSGGGTYRGKLIPSLLESNAVTTVLFDTGNPSRNEAYPGVKQWIEILPA